MRVLGFVFALALATTGSAYAEKVKTNQETRVLNHPGEQGKLVVKVKEGQSMTLLSSEGRWLPTATRKQCRAPASPLLLITNRAESNGAKSRSFARISWGLRPHRGNRRAQHRKRFA